MIDTLERRIRGEYEKFSGSAILLASNNIYKGIDFEKMFFKHRPYCLNIQSNDGRIYTLLDYTIEHPYKDIEYKKLMKPVFSGSVGWIKEFEGMMIR